MARSEARLSCNIWGPESDFTQLDSDAQWMYAFLLSQSDLAHTGVIPLRPRRWSRAATNLTEQDITSRLDTLAAERYVVIDHDTEELLVRSLIRGDKIYRQPNVLRAAADQLALIVSPRLRRALAVEVARIEREQMPAASAAILAEMRAALPSVEDNAAGDEGSANPSEDPSGEASGNHARPTPGVRGVVTAVSSDSPYPVPRSPEPRSPGTPTASPRAHTRATTDRASESKSRGTRIPDDFEATPEMIEWAKEHTPAVGARETDAFIDYWRGIPGPKGRKLNWIATWRNWMRRAQADAERRGTTHSRASTPTPRPSTTDQRMAEAVAAGVRVQAMLDRGEITSGRG